MVKQFSVTEYKEKFDISRHAVHRRIEKIDKEKKPFNNIIAVKRLGPKIIILDVDTSIKFKKK